MNVVDEVIFAVWVAFWIYWLAASIGVKAAGHNGPGWQAPGSVSFSSSCFSCAPGSSTGVRLSAIHGGKASA